MSSSARNTGFTRRRVASAGVVVVGGGAMCLAAWIGGQPGLAVVLTAFYVVCTVVILIWTGRSSDAASVMASRADERQKAIDLRATAYSGLAMTAFAIGGAILDIARGGGGDPWTTMCAVGAGGYVIAFLVLKNRT